MIFAERKSEWLRGFARLALLGLLGATVGQADEEGAIEAAVAAREHEVEAAYLEGDSDFLQTVLHPGFRFTHANGAIEGRADTLENFARAGNFSSRELTSLEVEVHGQAALTSGRIEVTSSRAGRYTICYVRLYLLDDDAGWQLASHRSYRGAPGHEETCRAR